MSEIPNGVIICDNRGKKMKDGGSIRYDVLNDLECGFRTVIHDHSRAAKEKGFFPYYAETDKTKELVAYEQLRFIDKYQYKNLEKMSYKRFIGQHVRKKNNTLFNNRTPIYLIENITPLKQRFAVRLRFNGTQTVDTNINSIEIISHDRASELLAIFIDSHILAECDNNSPHFRKDTGAEKVSISEEHFPRVLYKKRVENPEGNFQAYKCPVCNGIHIGKSDNT